MNEAFRKSKQRSLIRTAGAEVMEADFGEETGIIEGEPLEAPILPGNFAARKIHALRIVPTDWETTKGYVQLGKTALGQPVRKAMMAAVSRGSMIEEYSVEDETDQVDQGPSFLEQVPPPDAKTAIKITEIEGSRWKRIEEVIYTGSLPVEEAEKLNLLRDPDVDEEDQGQLIKLSDEAQKLGTIWGMSVMYVYDQQGTDLSRKETVAQLKNDYQIEATGTPEMKKPEEKENVTQPGQSQSNPVDPAFAQWILSDQAKKNIR